MHPALSGLTPMTVRTPDFALRDLRLKPRQTTPARHQPRDVGGLVSHVIKIENQRITFAAIDTPTMHEQ
jgi:hypothetical protein